MGEDYVFSSLKSEDYEERMTQEDVWWITYDEGKNEMKKRDNRGKMRMKKRDNRDRKSVV